jgi:hypothetical protein
MLEIDELGTVSGMVGQRADEPTSRRAKNERNVQRNVQEGYAWPARSGKFDQRARRVDELQWML